MKSIVFMSPAHVDLMQRAYLALHDALLVGGPAKLGGDEGAGRIGQAAGDGHLLHALAQGLLQELRQPLVRLARLLDLRAELRASVLGSSSSAEQRRLCISCRPPNRPLCASLNSTCRRYTAQQLQPFHAVACASQCVRNRACYWQFESSGSQSQ